MKDEKIKKVNIFLLVIIGILLVVLVLVLINKPKSYFITREKNDEKIVDITFKLGTFSNPKKVKNDIEKMLDKYEELFDDEKANKDNNNLYYINHELELNKPLKIDEDLYRLIRYGKDDIYTQSEGKLNICDGYLVKVYEEAQINGLEKPSESVLSNINIDINAITLNDDEITITKTSDVLINLNEVKNGFIVDEITYYLDNLQIKNYKVKVGNITAVGGATLNEKYHKVKQGNTTLKLNYLATSTVNNTKLHLNSNTKQIPNKIKSVTVVALLGTTAEYYSSLLYTMSIEDGLKLINDVAKVEAIWYDLDGKTYKSDGFSLYE